MKVQLDVLNKSNALVAAFLVLGLCAACGSKSGGGSSIPANEPASVTQARTQFPHFIDLQTNLISSTCSPNPGVCHNSSNYPNMQTAGDTLAFVGAPCNAEIPDPLEGWDNCERRADTLSVGSFSSEIAWITQLGAGSWTLGLKSAPPSDLSADTWTVTNSAGVIVFESIASFDSVVTGTAGSPTLSIATTGSNNTFVIGFVDQALQTVIPGDPNQNGTWGAEDPSIEAMSAAVFFPGSEARSYMWGRITATVPGTRMPLANDPITEPAYVAVACWIEGLKGGGLDQPEDAIDYDHCKFALNPVNYAIP